MADKVDNLNGTSTFPTSPSAFDDDERVSYSRADEKYILETREGGEYEWDSSLRRWIPAVGDALRLFAISILAIMRQLPLPFETANDI